MSAAPSSRVAWLTWLPNSLSLLRLVIGVVFPFVPSGWRLPLVLVAALTDAADGAASRLLHADSAIGRLLDPLADKVFMVGVLLALLGDGTLTPSAVILVGFRDVLIGIGGLCTILFARRREWFRLKPTWLGKLTTVTQFLFLAAVLTLGRCDPLFYLTAGLSVLTTFDYLRRYLLMWCRPTHRV